MKPTKKSHLALYAGTLTTLAIATSVSATQKKPNILFIFSDDHSTKAIGAYGSPYIKTPNIDKIAKDGAVFVNSFCANSICQPSRATVLTGKHSHLNGVTDNEASWNPNQQVWPRLLSKKAGYDTALIGKWHMHPTPTNEFDYATVLNGHGGQGTYFNPEFIDNKGVVEHTKGYSADIIAKKAVDWLDNSWDKSKPFSLMVQFKAPHTPRQPPLRNLQKFANVTFPEPETLYDDYSTRGPEAANAWMEIYGMADVGFCAFPPKGDTPKKLEIRKKWLAGMQKSRREVYFEWEKELTEEQSNAWHKAFDKENIEYYKMNQSPSFKRLSGKRNKENYKARVGYIYQRFMRNYMACVATIDENVGRLLKCLDDKNLTKNTIVVYSSDQSYFLGEHGWAEKRFMYDEAMRQPFIIRWPGVIKAGQKPKALIQNIDYAPTFIEAAGLKVPSDIQGKSLLTMLKTQKTPKNWRKSLYYHYYMEGGHNVPRHDGVRTDRYKLVNYYGHGNYELYDLKKDPTEVNNVFDNPEYSAIKEKMLAEHLKLRHDYKVPDSHFIAPYHYQSRKERKEKKKANTRKKKHNKKK